ncbi:MAG: hypothetical protein HYY40_07985 [Bacteroidetes bacterium]|nr:hypothetical protein [Bacteroidota bacterium]
MKLKSRYSLISPISLISLPFLLLPSCSNDFEVIDKWKDITIVYGVLNQDDPVQYIRIQRAFLGKENAYTMAQSGDSIYYPDGALTVNMEEYDDNNAYLKTISLSPTYEIAKDTGSFNNSGHKLYKSNDSLEYKNTYKLIITNNSTGKTINAVSPLIHPVIISKPVIGKKINFFNKGLYQSERIEWKSSPNGRLYQPVLRFYYAEDNNGIAGWDDTLTVDWVQMSYTAQNLTGNQSMLTDLAGEEFFKYLKSQIPENSTVSRYFIKMELLIYVAGDELSTYYSINQPSLGIVQEKPVYTNIKNNKGEDEIGIFSCRLIARVDGLSMAFDTCVELTSGQYTQTLGFTNICQ